MVNLVSCENFTEELKAAITSASPEDKAAICEALNCGSDLNEIVSAITPNMLEVAEDGKLIVKPANMVSSEENNILEIGADGKLYVNKTAASVVAEDLVSGDVGNIIVTGSDNKLYARVDPSNPKDFISDSADNAITTGPDGGLFVEKTKDVVPGDLISTDANNIITKGTDSKLYAKVDTNSLVSSEADNQLTVKGDGKLYVEKSGGISDVDEIISTNEGNLIVKGTDNKMAVSGQGLLSSDSGNDLKLGTDKKLFYDRGITWTTEDPGAGSPLETGHIVFVYEEVQTWNITYVSGSEADDVQNLPSNTSVLNNADYIIPSTPPTREGYTFNNYSDGSTTHAPGSHITVTADVTLTAQWTQAS